MMSKKVDEAPTKMDEASSMTQNTGDSTVNKEQIPANPETSVPQDVSPELLQFFYKQMVFIREFDRRLLRLQRAGRLGTYAPVEGQEACQVGSAQAMREGDFLVPTYRDSGAMMLRGFPVSSVLLYWNGRLEGLQIPAGVSVFPLAIPIASQLPHAAGIAWAAKLQHKDQVTLAMFGDGATSEGDFHEAMNFAGVFQLPMVFFCENNQYAISLPVSRQTATETLAEKAAAYGFSGQRVDGGDVLAVYRAVRDAIAKAAMGQGPTLIEALTYRYGAHTTSDDPTKYRTEEELASWRQQDPVVSFGSRLRQWGLWGDAQEQQWQAQVQEKLIQAVAVMEGSPPARPTDLFEHVYAQLPPRLRAQKAALEKEVAQARGGVQ
ncbi:pyruvate dehydrogenase (acetyl-transferring) E1 component subunit alpha [Alicyclobacillaceae bacterium I2511]|nr:pyruvate dehydrogenase (acetyl-transferring) E1 component subunit alpha [Alicyclobacillaceae bacterium I2511]